MGGESYVDKVAGQIEAVLEKQADKTMSYGDLRKIFENVDGITYFSAISRLRGGKRLKRVTEGKTVKYVLV